MASTEPFHYSPLKLYEYMACGRPIVAAAAGELARVIVDDLNGLLVPLGEVDPIVDAIERLASDADLRQRLGVEARKTAQRDASWEVRAASLARAMEARGLVPTTKTSLPRPQT
jgi:glycosyltransferase involved in cell wall biosynthesis